MVSFLEKSPQEVIDALKPANSIAILSCGLCPALQKKGGLIGIEKWKGFLEKEFCVKWTLTGPMMCDEVLWITQFGDMLERLDDVDKLAVMTCKLGLELAENLLGFDCVACLVPEYTGTLMSDGTIRPSEYR